MSLSLFSLDGKVAIVTKASRGIGKAIALSLADAGAIDTTGGEIVARGRKALAVPTDKVMMEQNKGSIVNIASIAGLRGYTINAAYRAAKAGIIAFTKTLSIDLGPHNIRVNCIAPASVATEGWLQLGQTLVIDGGWIINLGWKQQ